MGTYICTTTQWVNGIEMTEEIQVQINGMDETDMIPNLSCGNYWKGVSNYLLIEFTCLNMSIFYKYYSVDNCSTNRKPQSKNKILTDVVKKCCNR